MTGDDRFKALVGALAVAAVAWFAVWRLVLWVRAAPRRPDPWDAETEEAMNQSDVVEVCHHCSTPHPPTAWFCEHCGAAVGPYNNYMPYVDVFSQGEVLRSGVMDRVRVSFLSVTGYILLSIVFTPVAPLYWYFLARNLRRRQTAASDDSSAQPT